MEDRGAFITRLRQAVQWVNKNRADYLEQLSQCQKEWAQDVLDAQGLSIDTLYTECVNR